jgi:hypothetical protein
MHLVEEKKGYIRLLSVHKSVLIRQQKFQINLLLTLALKIKMYYYVIIIIGILTA